MSNVTTASVNLCRDPETIQMGEREATKVRVADNTGSRNETRFFNVLFTGRDAETANRLRQGDKIIVTGQLVVNSYKAKKDGKGVKKGQTMTSDEMPFARLMEVVKSPSFFSDEEPAAKESANTEAPDLEADDPLADV
jgi:single-stranded DNA-binding protein